jgi:hypothetical protein
MAPEQAAGEADRIDPRTDVYGLGAVLYAMLTGQAPHAGTSLREVLAAARSGRVRPPEELRPGLPAAVGAVCRRCLEADPGKRFPSAGEAAQALRRCMELRGRAWRWWTMAAALALTVGGLAAWVDARFGHKNPPPAAHPDGRLLRHDFALHVGVPGGTLRIDGVVALRARDPLRLTLEASRDCFVHVFYIDAAGHSTCVLPNREETDNSLKAGQPRRFPDPPPGEKRHHFRLKSSDGVVEHLHVIASTVPWQPPEASTTTRDGLFRIFEGDAIRGLEWVDEPARDTPHPLVAEQMVPFVVETES